jgi:hypothetical protein
MVAVTRRHPRTSNSRPSTEQQMVDAAQNVFDADAQIGQSDLGG